MLTFDTDNYSKELKSTGTILIPSLNSFLMDTELKRLEELADNLPMEHIEIGDANEPNFLNVGRFMTDIEDSLVVNEEISREAISILGSEEKMMIYCKLLGKRELFLRRMQYNVMNKDSFIGLHLDIDSNPDYLVAVVIQFGDDYEGGEFVLHNQDRVTTFKSKKYDIIVSDCLIPHEVKKIKNGNRKSLVYFLSENGGPNRRNKN